MGNQYSINLENYSLQKFKQSLNTRELIPSRVSLKDDMDKRFSQLESQGITNLQELIDRLKTRQKIYEFAASTRLTAEYLTLLKREARSYLSNPVRLDTFKGIPSEFVARLADEGIKNTRHMFDKAMKKGERQLIAQRTGIPVEVINELVCLSDLTRAYGVGPVFARMIYDMGIQTIEEFIETSPEEFIRIYEEKEGKKADFGVNEIQFSLELAKELDIAVEI